MSQIYRPLYLNQAPILYTSRRTAELIKYAANAFLATKITFINEIADLAEQVGANVQDIARGMGLDNRIGTKFLHAGPGYGGSCFPKDTRALSKTALDYGVQLRVVEATLTVNETRKRTMSRKVAGALGNDIRGKTIAVLGLTFKPDTDDMREAPSIALIAGLLDFGARVKAHDPVGMEQAKKELPDIEYYDDPYSCAGGADALVIVTEWRQFRALDLERIRTSMATPVIVDLRNIYRPEDVLSAGSSMRVSDDNRARARVSDKLSVSPSMVAIGRKHQLLPRMSNEEAALFLAFCKKQPQLCRIRNRRKHGRRVKARPELDTFRRLLSGLARSGEYRVRL